MDSTEWVDLPVEQILTDVGLGAQGPPFPQVFVAVSPDALSNAVSDALSLGLEVPGSGVGTYLGACMGVKPSGGFSVAIESARRKGNQVTIHLALQDLGRNEIAFQAMTSPFTVAVIRDLDPREKAFSFVAELDWEVVHVGG
ncbi:MAG: protease complex subunit PrcB family protein [Actinomycetota bacterium]|nr:protease complex subunit PrcB family protein [Actinomycetota bacterium]